MSVGDNTDWMQRYRGNRLAALYEKAKYVSFQDSKPNIIGEACVAVRLAVGEVLEREEFEKAKFDHDEFKDLVLHIRDKITRNLVGNLTGAQASTIPERSHKISDNGLMIGEPITDSVIKLLRKIEAIKYGFNVEEKAAAFVGKIDESINDSVRLIEQHALSTKIGQGAEENRPVSR